MDGHGGLVPSHAVMSALIATGMPPVTFLRIVWALTKVGMVLRSI
jgi:hypothetical protein